MSRGRKALVYSCLTALLVAAFVPKSVTMAADTATPPYVTVATSVIPGTGPSLASWLQVAEPGLYASLTDAQRQFATSAHVDDRYTIKLVGTTANSGTAGGTAFESDNSPEQTFTVYDGATYDLEMNGTAPGSIEGSANILAQTDASLPVPDDSATIQFLDLDYHSTVGRFPLNPGGPTARVPAPQPPTDCIGLCTTDSRWAASASGQGSYDLDPQPAFPTGFSYRASEQFVIEFHSSVAAANTFSSYTEDTCFYLKATQHFFDFNIPPVGWTFDGGGFFSCLNYPL